MKTPSFHSACLLALLLASAAPSGHAQERSFPEQARRGKMTPAPHPEIVIDGKLRRLSPAARIFGEDNLIKMPASLRGSAIAVNYEEDGEGQILRVWLLTAQEAAAPAPGQGRR